MFLYHFTSTGHVPTILEWGGLEKGDVMVGPRGELSLKATWLTTNFDPAHVGMDYSDLEGLPFPEQYRAVGMPDVIQKGVDKTEVRIKIKIPSTDRHLHHWYTFAKKKLGQHLIDLEIRMAGSKRRVEDWYFYDGLISTARFEVIEVKNQDGAYRIATHADLNAMTPHVIGWSGGAYNYEMENRPE